MEADRLKWNSRFAAEASCMGEAASPFLRREIDRLLRLVPGRRALDIASGEGRNAIFLAQRGFQVTALDISDVGIAKGERRAAELGVHVDFCRVDLDEFRISEQYDLILNFNFLLRPLISEEVNALAPGGLLMLDTILESPELLQKHTADYFLRYGELEQLFAEYHGSILFHEECRDGTMPTARIMFRKAGNMTDSGK